MTFAPRDRVRVSPDAPAPFVLTIGGWFKSVGGTPDVFEARDVPEAWYPALELVEEQERETLF